VNDTIVTVVGNVVDSPRRVNTQNGAVTNFRMASTARRYDVGTQQWIDAATFWVDVECWNALSGNVSGSVCKGDPVIVHGALTTHQWDSDSGPRSKPRIKAFVVGPNLQKGRAVFTKDRSVGRAAEPVDALTSEPFGTEPGDETPASVEELVAGRDYEVAGEALDYLDADLPREPAHA
jgi:single-strand DNA-binding protein